MTFKDHFSKQAGDYSKFRPSYPAELYAYLDTLVAEHACAWDCGTGNGQAAIALAGYFDSVIATDASQQQIDNATPHERVSYRVATAEHSTLDDHSVDLITVAQALHWFDLDKFYAEVRRVAKPQAAIAVWVYELMQFDDPAVQAVLDYCYRDLVGSYWPPERIHCETRYQQLPFPFKEFDTPDFSVQYHWTKDAFLGYLSTWSAVQRYISDLNSDPISTLIQPRLDAIWSSEEQKTLKLIFSMRAGNVF
ncbi:MAG: class I SAM-dependent methyltransferase [Coxiellaceae bacterium]|nr:class I SAM-dependent methyltransferase [Coxiellaceae bacterium]